MATGRSFWDLWLAFQGMSPSEAGGTDLSPELRKQNMDLLKILNQEINDYYQTTDKIFAEERLTRLKQIVEHHAQLSDVMTDLEGINSANYRARVAAAQRDAANYRDNVASVRGRSSAFGTHAAQEARAAKSADTVHGWGAALSAGLGAYFDQGQLETESGVTRNNISASLQNISNAAGLAPHIKYDNGEIVARSEEGERFLKHYGTSVSDAEWKRYAKMGYEQDTHREGALAQLEAAQGKMGELQYAEDDGTLEDRIREARTDMRKALQAVDDAFTGMDPKAALEQRNQYIEENEHIERLEADKALIMKLNFPEDVEAKQRIAVFADPWFQEWARQKGYTRIGTVNKHGVYARGRHDDRALREYALESRAGLGRYAISRGLPRPIAQIRFTAPVDADSVVVLKFDDGNYKKQLVEDLNTGEITESYVTPEAYAQGVDDTSPWLVFEVEEGEGEKYFYNQDTKEIINRVPGEAPVSLEIREGHVYQSGQDTPVDTVEEFFGLTVDESGESTIGDGWTPYSFTTFEDTSETPSDGASYTAIGELKPHNAGVYRLGGPDARLIRLHGYGNGSIITTPTEIEVITEFPLRNPANVIADARKLLELKAGAQRWKRGQYRKEKTDELRKDIEAAREAENLDEVAKLERRLAMQRVGGFRIIPKLLAAARTRARQETAGTSSDVPLDAGMGGREPGIHPSGEDEWYEDDSATALVGSPIAEEELDGASSYEERDDTLDDDTRKEKRAEQQDKRRRKRLLARTTRILEGATDNKDAADKLLRLIDRMDPSDQDTIDIQNVVDTLLAHAEPVDEAAPEVDPDTAEPVDPEPDEAEPDAAAPDAAAPPEQTATFEQLWGEDRVDPVDKPQEEVEEEVEVEEVLPELLEVEKDGRQSIVANLLSRRRRKKTDKPSPDETHAAELKKASEEIDASMWPGSTQPPPTTESLWGEDRVDPGDVPMGPPARSITTPREQAAEGRERRKRKQRQREEKADQAATAQGVSLNPVEKDWREYVENYDRTWRQA